jgi:hypothetical protein
MPPLPGQHVLIGELHVAVDDVRVVGGTELREDHRVAVGLSALDPVRHSDGVDLIAREIAEARGEHLHHRRDAIDMKAHPRPRIAGRVRDPVLRA